MSSLCLRTPLQKRINTNIQVFHLWRTNGLNQKNQQPLKTICWFVTNQFPLTTLKCLLLVTLSSIWKSKKVSQYRVINQFWIKMKHLCHYICLISYTNILQSYDYLVLPFIHCYLLFVAFSDKIYAPVSFKTVLKNLLIKILLNENMAWKCVQ